MEQKQLCGIYRITSPVGKIYIGQSKNFEQRFSDYRRGRCPQQRKLFNSFYKYGFSNHTIEIIEICDVEELNCRERYWQDFYDVKDRDKGLNCVLVACGDKKEERFPSYRTEKINKKEKVTDLRCGNTPLGVKGRILTEFEKFKLSVSKGKYSPEEKQELLDNFKEGDLEKRYLKVRKTAITKVARNEILKDNSKIILDTQTGVFYYGIKDLSKLYNLNYETIKSRLNGKLKNNTQFMYV